jgi:DNA-binding NtrC family response regulator
MTPRVGRVLIIDDEVRVYEALKRVLSNEFEVVATQHPAEALEWLVGGDWYDVVLCDVMMPTMNGIELRNRLHAARADQAARIVFVTGGLVWDRVRQLVESVPNLVLEKPIDLTALRELIRRRVRSDEPPRRSASGGAKVAGHGGG